MDYIIELLNITKEFPGIKANDNVTLKLKPQTIHAVLGENGAGKSTLMSILFGLYQPEEGKIRVRGKDVKITNPNIANDLGIGMVHQHFKLVEDFTVVENIILGSEPTTKFGTIDIASAAEKVSRISEQYGLKVDPYAKIKDISVGMQQRVEILKMLYRDAEVLIFDEPTAVLTPQEIEELLNIMKGLIKKGKSILLITHKLAEIKQVADECSVLQKGRYIGTVNVAETDTLKMAEMMVGRNVNFTVEKTEAKPKQTVLKVENIMLQGETDKPIINNVSFEVKAGEIFCVAGIEGNGQTELVELITGLEKLTSGKITLNNNEIQNLSIRKRTEAGIGHIPEDRHKHGLVLEYSVEENMALQTYYMEPLSKNGIINRGEVRKLSDELIERFDVRSGKGSETTARSMSGGNQQKAIIAREINRSPDLLIAVQPTRGLDVGAIEYIHKELIRERDSGKAVLLVSLELDEVLDVSDRIAVMYEGEIMDTVYSKDTNENELGLMMTGSKKAGDK
ncbi:ABC transporter ATP-binding protein [Acidaminobacter sp. JC074]|uniref:ABC transporter ATP-binding protein n=1 Tax=Acidaminobacter sp. JC074 TaxID=2530199 RepID=UPI001F0E4779|nr:ABC transporter ATP-binding protein [Acidaminobacter sp. JC074]MCH4889144.1 ABC transporter ATP-binding protein [Acidaminobacter sp. JC074]